MIYLKVDIGGRDIAALLPKQYSTPTLIQPVMQAIRFHGLFNKGSQGEKENISTSIQLLQILQCEQRGGL